MADDLKDVIQETAQGPAEASNATERMKAQPLADLIEADRYLASKAASTSKRRGIRFSKIVPPGAD